MAAGRAEERRVEVVDVAVGRGEPVAAGRVVDRHADDRARATRPRRASRRSAPPKLKMPPSAAAGAVRAGVGAGIRERRLRGCRCRSALEPRTLTVPLPFGTTTTADFARRRQHLGAFVDPNLIVACSSPTPRNVITRAGAVPRFGDIDVICGHASPDAIGTPNPVERSKPFAALNAPPWLRVRSLLPGVSSREVASS